MRTQKIISLFIVFALFLGIMGVYRSYAAEGTTIDLSLSPAIEGRYEYYTNEETLINLDLDLSGYDTNISNAELMVSVPKEYLALMVGSQIGSATGPVVSATADGKYILTYHFNQLTGGTSMQIPIRVRTIAGDTPNNYLLPISATLMSSTSEVLATADPLELKQIVRDPKIIKTKSINGSTVTTDGSISYGGQGTAADINIIKPGTEVNQLFNFSVAFENVIGTTSANYLGVRKYEKMVITDTLPAGAVFSAAANPGWTYDSATNTVSYTLMNPSLQSGSTSYLQLSIPSLKLTFPNGDTRITYMNTAQIEFFPQNKQDYEGPNVTSTDGIKFQMTTNLPTGISGAKTSSNFIDQIDKKTAPQTWNCYYTNPSDTYSMENLVMEDYNLDPRMEYVSVRLGGGTSNFVGTIDIEGVDIAGNVTTIMNNAPWQGTTEYPIPAGTVKIVIKSTDGSYLLPLKQFNFYVKTKLKDPTNVHFNGSVAINNRFQNTIKVTGEYVGTNATATGTRIGTIYITEYKPTVYLTKTNSVASLFVGEETTFNLTARASGTLLDPDTIQESSIIDLLPQGLDYVVGSINMGTTYSNMLVSKEPTIIKNYKGTGKTALIWEFAVPIKPASTYMSLSYKAKATKEMTKGLNTNEAYWIWDNNGTGSPSTQQVVISSASYGRADTLDSDNDGNLTETVAYAAATVTYVPPREVIASKHAKGSLDVEDTLDGGRTEIGDSFSYTLKVWNNSISDVNRLAALEVLPYVGDKTIAPDAAGDYLNRGSEFPVTLTGPIVGPIGYTVSYTTDLPASDSAASPANYGNNANWVDAAMISDWSTIRGIKIIMNTGVVLAKDATINFHVPVKSPADMSLIHGETAFNSFAISMNGGNDFLEAKAVSTSIVSYKVTGTMFEDGNKDGLLGTAEAAIANREVQLFNEDGTPALDLDGNLIKTTTKEDGTYQLIAYNKGTYYIHVAPPDYFRTTDKGDDNNNLASHVGTTTGNTDTFDVTADINAVVRNAGYYANTGDLTIKKVLQDSDGNPIEETREFTVMVTGPSYPSGKEMTLSNETPLILEHLEFGTYEVKELNAQNYEVSISGTVTLSFENQTGEITVQNKEKIVETTSLDIEKIVKGEPNVDETFTFELIPVINNFPSPAAVIEKKEITIKGAGTASFGTWTYTSAGVYSYQMQEVAGGNSHYTYDQTVYTITDTVTLNDDGDLEVARTVKNNDDTVMDGVIIFTNQFKSNEEFPNTEKPEIPAEEHPVSTGDSSQTSAWMFLAALALCALISLSLFGYYTNRKVKK